MTDTTTDPFEAEVARKKLAGSRELVPAIVMISYAQGLARIPRARNPMTGGGMRTRYWMQSNSVRKPTSHRLGRQIVALSGSLIIVLINLLGGTDERDRCS